MTGRTHWRRSLTGALLLLVASVVTTSPLPANATESPAHLSVWRVINKKRSYSGTAFAVRERHFLTNAHVIQGFIEHDSRHIVLTQRGNTAELTVNFRHAALSLTYDLALFTTREEVEHVLELESRSTPVHGARLRIIGYPETRFAVAEQAEGTLFEDALSYRVPMDRPIAGGFSGAPMLNDGDRVVGVFHSAAGNMAAAVRPEHVHDFLEGKLQWTACRDYASPDACLEAAIEATTRAAEAGDVLAQYQLGKESGLPGHIEWLIRAGEQGFADAQDKLGDHYRDSKDWERAAHWYKRAAVQRHPLAMQGMADLYHEGRGVARDPQRAFRLTRESANAGSTAAQYNLGVLYLWGAGTPVDRELGAHWLAKAAARGDEEARKLLDEMK